MENVCLRYYFEKELIERYRYSSNPWDRKYWEPHQEIKNLLSKIKEKLGISFELFEFFRKTGRQDTLCLTCKNTQKKNVKIGIVCEKAADEIINIAKRYIDNIWVVK